MSHSVEMIDAAISSKRIEAGLPATKATMPRFHSRFGYVLLTILATFTGMEVITRMWLIPASKDLARFANYSHHAEQLTKKPGTRIALIGNSTTQRGVNLTELTDQLQLSTGQPFSTDMFVADASKINTWYYMLNQYFWKAGRKPDLFVVTFYENNLIDGNRMEIGRVAQFFTDQTDWPELFQNELNNLSDQAEFVFSSYWATLAARDRIKQRVMKALVPGFEDYRFAINTAGHEQVTKKNSSQPVVHGTLERLLEHAKRDGTRFVFVAFPTRDCRIGNPYSLREETTKVIEDSGMIFIDLRNIPALTEEMYADKLHLTEAGQMVYSNILANRLAPALSKIAAR